ncbi:hypothetical protein PS623_04625 [Pseudomonas fluorescens]|nr:hypothetical protein PS623_04625 [Pseudomonas fluorescens]
MGHADWEASVTEAIAEVLEISYSEATGVIEAQDFYIQQSWGLGLNPQETAAKIIGKGNDLP